ncbi:hypothetical protein V5F53_04080 [Xanthobacter sp. V4C-4]|uniref:hypothetical protein n=1 Tax=Xanthobacter cornucopiae TaxID=3119924 RepID=UPI00372CD302
MLPPSQLVLAGTMHMAASAPYQEITRTMSTRSTADSDESSPKQKRKAARPAFEIVYEEEQAPAGVLARVRAGLEPVALLLRDTLSGAYVRAARTVLDRVEAFEDQRAERQARQHAAAATPHPQAPPPQLIDGPVADGQNQRTPASGKSGPRARAARAKAASAIPDAATATPAPAPSKRRATRRSPSTRTST